MNRFFNDFFTSFDMLNLSVFEDTWRFIPKVTVTNDSTKIVISAEIPGMSAEDIEITLRSDSLIITGRNGLFPAPDHTSYDFDAATSIPFQKTVPIPMCIDAAAVKASFKNGMLKVILPKCPEKSRIRHHIPVKKTGRTS